MVGAVIHDPVGDDTAFALRGRGRLDRGAGRHAPDLRVAAPVPVAA